MIQLNLLTDEGGIERHFTLACGERPQERMENYGAGSLSDAELIAMLLQGNGMTPEATVLAASRLIAAAGSMAGLATWTSADYRRVKGIGRIKGMQLATLTEIARRMMDTRTDRPVLQRPDQIATYLRPIATGLQVEKFWVLCLNRKNRLIRRVEISSGTATATVVHPREVFRAVIQASATAFVCAHNHPSGDPAPSTADLHVTRQLREAAKAVDIPLVDHVVVGNVDGDPLARGYYSFREMGLL